MLWTVELLHSAFWRYLLFAAAETAIYPRVTLGEYVEARTRLQNYIPHRSPPWGYFCTTQTFLADFAAAPPTPSEVAPNLSNRSLSYSGRFAVIASLTRDQNPRNLRNPDYCLLFYLF